MILSIPYKALSRCGIDELAVQQQWNERAGKATGGMLFARKEDHAEKDEARRAILNMLTLEKSLECLSVLSMPGMTWEFERRLLGQRECRWSGRSYAGNVRLTCVENDRFIYYSALTKIPRNAQCVIRALPAPSYAECTMGHGFVDRYIFANVDDLMQHSDETFDVAWLDYTGPLSVARMKIIQRFWRDRVRSKLIITSLKARWNRETADTIVRNGGCMNWMRKRLPGTELHAMEYQDGASPMIQIALSK